MEYKMYGIAMRHLQGIQKGIQAWHAGMKYAYEYGHTKEFKRYITKDETIILKEAGTTDQLEKAARKLKRLGYKVVKFHEPDLGDSLTAIVFLVDEKVWNRDKNPEPDGDDLVIRQFLDKFPLATN